MVAKILYESGVDVEHIMSDGKLQSHSELNERLMNMYFPDRKQISLFAEHNLKIFYFKHSRGYSYRPIVLFCPNLI